MLQETEILTNKNRKGIAGPVVHPLTKPPVRIRRRPSRSITQEITEFAGERYKVLKPVRVTLFREGEEWAASWFEGNVHTAGANEQEAFENLSSYILDVYETMVKEPKLSVAAQRQLDVFRAHIAPA